MDDLVSCVVCTLNRPQYLRKCIDSLYNQKYKNIEIVIIDQSDDINDSFFQNERVRYIHINERGLSNARNVALLYCSGKWISLIDDDATYDENYLSTAMNFIEEHNKKVGIISGTGYDKDSKVFLLPSMKKNKIIKVGWNTIFKYCMSAGMIIRSDLINSCGFDVNFGVGAGTIYGSGEESDVVIYALKNKEPIFFNPNMIFYHKAELIPSMEKTYYYNCGKGGLLKKYFLNYDKVLFITLFLKSVFRSVIGCGLYLMGKKCYKKSFYALRGKIKGFVTYRD